jgi:hypothetical protein
MMFHKDGVKKLHFKSDFVCCVRRSEVLGEMIYATGGTQTALYNVR